MEFSVGHFFETAKEIGVLQFLLARQSAAAIVCDQAFYSYLKPLSDNKPYALLLFGEVSSKSVTQSLEFANVFICVSGDQQIIKRSLSDAFPRSRLFSLWSEVVPALSVGCSPLAIPGPAEVRTKLAIICAARSGSEYLCSVLSGLKGLGSPKEHLRAFTVDLIRTKSSSGFSLQDWFHMVVRCGTHEGTFSTKIIGEFVTELDLSTLQSRAIMQRLLSDFKFVRIRRDKVEQAVSAYIASAARQWHVIDETHLGDYRRKRENIPYNLPAIKWLFDKSMKAEASIDNILEAAGADALVIEYSDMIGDIDNVIFSILRHVGLSHDGGKISSGGFVRTFDEKNAEFCSRFSADLKASPITAGQ